MMETQSLRSGNESFDVNRTLSPWRPTETSVPRTRIEWEAGGAVSNRTWTPDSTVRVTPPGTVTSLVTR